MRLKNLSKRAYRVREMKIEKIVKRNLIFLMENKMLGFRMEDGQSWPLGVG